MLQLQVKAHSGPIKKVWHKPEAPHNLCKNTSHSTPLQSALSHFQQQTDGTFCNIISCPDVSFHCIICWQCAPFYLGVLRFYLAYKTQRHYAEASVCRWVDVHPATWAPNWRPGANRCRPRRAVKARFCMFESGGHIFRTRRLEGQVFIPTQIYMCVLLNTAPIHNKQNATACYFWIHLQC